MSMHSQDRSLLTNNSIENKIKYWKKKKKNLFIAMKKINRVNREKKLITWIAIITRLICSSIINYECWNNRLWFVSWRVQLSVCYLCMARAPCPTWRCRCHWSWRGRRWAGQHHHCPVDSRRHTRTDTSPCRSTSGHTASRHDDRVSGSVAPRMTWLRHSSVGTHQTGTRIVRRVKPYNDPLRSVCTHSSRCYE